MAGRALRILLPVDGSAAAETILGVVLPLGERKPLHLELLSVIDDESVRASAESYLAKAEEALKHSGIDVRVENRKGTPASTIVAHAIATKPDLIAMTTHGRTGLNRLLMGSVTEEVLRHAPAPLVVSRPGSRMEGWHHVVALDGSTRAESILDDIVPLTRLLGATLHLLHVESRLGTVESHLGIRGPGGWDAPSYLARMSSYATALGVSVTTAQRQGGAAAEILRYAADVRAGLIAIATHGRSGLERVVMGSVAEEVLRRSSCPLVLRRQPGRFVTMAPGAAIA